MSNTSTRPDSNPGSRPSTSPTFNAMHDKGRDLGQKTGDIAGQAKDKVQEKARDLNEKVGEFAGQANELVSKLTAPVKPIEFDIPKQATSTGELRLSWYREPGLGGNGRGCQVAEVWLMKK